MSEEDSASVVNEIDIGALLRKTREDYSYSIAYVADQIHLRENVVEAIETNQFDQLPGPVYVRGYIRSYAKLLDIDPQPLIRQIEGDAAQIEPVMPVSEPIKIKSSRLDPIVIWSALTVFIVVIGLTITWWMQESIEDPVQLAEMVEQVEEVELSEDIISQTSPQQIQDVNEPTSQISLGDVSSENESSVQTEIPIANPIVNSSAEQEPIQNIAEDVVASSGLNQTNLTVIFNEESWAEIFDARKRRLLHGLIKPGATRVISGQAPFSIFLGNSPGVEFEVNGKKYDHSQYIRGNNTARFQIDDQNT